MFHSDVSFSLSLSRYYFVSSLYLLYCVRFFSFLSPKMLEWSFQTSCHASSSRSWALSVLCVWSVWPRMCFRPFNVRDEQHSAQLGRSLQQFGAQDSGAEFVQSRHFHCCGRRNANFGRSRTAWHQSIRFSKIRWRKRGTLIMIYVYAIFDSILQRPFVVAFWFWNEHTHTNIPDRHGFVEWIEKHLFAPWRATWWSDWF